MLNLQKLDEFFDHFEKIIEQYDKEEAFRMITTELIKCDDRYLIDFAGILNYLHYEKVLDWIESNAFRVQNVTDNWGHLAAMSSFSWKTCKRWLSAGRPLSLMALDALNYCTTVTPDRQNQSLLMRKINPQLIDRPDSETIIQILNVYLQNDSVPGTKAVVKKIIRNIQSEK